MGECSHCYRYEANYLSGNCLLSESWKSVSGLMMCTVYIHLLEASKRTYNLNLNFLI